MGGHHISDVVIAGAGPTGLGAAWRLTELACVLGDSTEWMLVEQSDDVGGMAVTHASDGFTWDVGGHVLFPHYRYVDALLDEVVEHWDRVTPVRGAWVAGRFVPYPLQQNLAALPVAMTDRILADLEQPVPEAPPRHFADFLEHQFGRTLCDAFFVPLNRKMWATDPAEMAFDWVDQRSGSTATNVPRLDRDAVRADVASGRLRPAWTPDTWIRYPRGGTGTIWSAVARRLPADRLRLATEITAVDALRRRVHLGSGDSIAYEHLVSSMPLDSLLRRVRGLPQATQRASRLRTAAVHVVGVGLRGRPIDGLRDVCSLYVADPDLPFWRITLLGNYSRSCVPDDDHWSLLCEVNVPDATQSTPPAVVDGVVDGLVRLGFVDRARIVTTWSRSITHGYPVPTSETAETVAAITSELERHGIIARGRFGGWRYDVSNQDHAFMQGLEAIDRICSGTPEVTYPRDSSVVYEDGRSLR